MKKFAIASVAIMAAAVAALPAQAEVSDDVVKIGILNDQSGVYADFGGTWSYEAAKMAVEDFGGTVLGKPIEVITADHQNKPDVAANIARQWYDQDLRQGKRRHGGRFCSSSAGDQRLFLVPFAGTGIRCESNRTGQCGS